ncbi:MAG: hypothetical protein HYW90_00775 [Candidatus Sungbacteria bacterium]|nr:hypothetical protein [Candidatus Sungbacteria bacterium]
MFTLYYLIFISVGTHLAYLYGKKTNRFLWKEYFALITAPLLGTAGLAFIFGWKPIEMFLLGMIILPTLEWLTGRAYHKVLGARLWIYERYPLPGAYTSWLTLPIWGAAMVLLWLIFKSI